jgi:prepilin-type N-terminal cleavage/methylation domain-containing protein
MSGYNQFRRNPHAFTLIELLTVIALVTILASVVTGSIQGVKERVAIGRARAELACIAQGLEDFKRRYGDYPQTDTAADGLSASKLLFSALIGAPVSDGSVNVSSTGPAFVQISKLTVESNGEIADETAASSNAFIDPWGRRYVYMYNRSGLSSSEPLLFSKGPDGLTTRSEATATSTGRASADSVNLDDIVAGEMP